MRRDPPMRRFRPSPEHESHEPHKRRETPSAWADLWFLWARIMVRGILPTVGLVAVAAAIGERQPEFMMVTAVCMVIMFWFWKD